MNNSDKQFLDLLNRTITDLKVASNQQLERIADLELYRAEFLNNLNEVTLAEEAYDSIWNQYDSMPNLKWIVAESIYRLAEIKAQEGENETAIVLYKAAEVTYKPIIGTMKQVAQKRIKEIGQRVARLKP